MRAAAIAIGLLAATGGSARAEPLSVGAFGQFQRIHGADAGGAGVMAETGVEHHKWTYFGELGLGALFVAPVESTRGSFLTLDLGARRMLREWGDRECAFGLYAEAAIGGTHFWYADNQHVTRPDLTLGWGWQLKSTDGSKFGMRSGLRLLLSVDDAEPLSNRAPRATTPTTSTSRIDGGMLGTIEVWW